VCGNWPWCRRWPLAQHLYSLDCRPRVANPPSAPHPERSTTLARRAAVAVVKTRVLHVSCAKKPSHRPPRVPQEGEHALGPTSSNISGGGQLFEAAPGAAARKRRSCGSSFGDKAAAHRRPCAGPCRSLTGFQLIEAGGYEQPG